MQPLNLRDVGLAHRLLNWAVFASFSFLYEPYLAFVAMPFSLYCIWRISSALQFNALAKTFCLLLSIIPLINIIPLLVLNGKATRVLKGAGIRVGLMGPNVNDLNENHIQQPTNENHIQQSNLREVGLAQRLMLWAVLAIIFSFLLIGPFRHLIPHGLGDYIPYLVIGLMSFPVYCVWRISSALQFNFVVKFLCLILSFLPLISSIVFIPLISTSPLDLLLIIILLLVLKFMATRVLKGAGIRVGLMGANVNDLNENHIEP